MSEKYEPSPAELRAAESSMDDRQRELTEVREDSLFEGTRLEKQKDGSQENQSLDWVNIIVMKSRIEQFKDLALEDMKRIIHETITSLALDQKQIGELQQQLLDENWDFITKMGHAECKMFRDYVEKIAINIRQRRNEG